MEDLNARLAEILGDEESMNKVRRMAESLLGEEQENEDFETGSDIDPKTLKRIMSLVTKFNSGKGDNRTALLLALKPHLKPERQKKVDTAVKLLRLVEILPELKDSGILDL